MPACMSTTCFYLHGRGALHSQGLCAQRPQEGQVLHIHLHILQRRHPGCEVVRLVQDVDRDLDALLLGE